LKLSTCILIVIPIIIISFCGGYWLNEILNQRYCRNEAIRMFVRAVEIGKEKGYLVVDYERMRGKQE